MFSQYPFVDTHAISDKSKALGKKKKDSRNDYLATEVNQDRKYVMYH